MGTARQFALLQKNSAGPTAEQLKRVFKTFHHLTDADAVRLAVAARGILMRRLGRDAARALQRVFAAEGIAVEVVAENDLPELPEGHSLHRLGVWPQTFAVYDLRGRRTAVAWPDIALIAAGAAQHYETSGMATDRAATSPPGGRDARAKRTAGVARKMEAEPQLLLEILLNDGKTRYQLDAAKFTFRYVIDRPGLSLQEKFIWLVREICRHATGAGLNSGARYLREGGETVPAYMNRQLLLDEMVWMLWQRREA